MYIYILIIVYMYIYIYIYVYIYMFIDDGISAYLSNFIQYNLIITKVIIAMLAIDISMAFFWVFIFNYDILWF